MRVKQIVRTGIFLFLSFCIAFATMMGIVPNIYFIGISWLLKDLRCFCAMLILTAVCFAIMEIWAHYVTKHTEIYTKRSSNLELCRVVCMILIVAHHAVVHGGSINIPEMTNNRFLSLLLLPGGKLSFDCFIAISCWFLVDQKFRMRRFLGIWTTVLFYSVSFTAVSALMGASISWYNWFSVFLPISGNSHGFAASYLAFYLLLPFLNKITEKITKAQARLLLLFIFYFEVGTQLVGYFAQYYQPMRSEIFVFVLCYLLALNLKRWPMKITENQWVMAGTAVIVWIIIWLANYYWAIGLGGEWEKFIVSTMGDESSVSNIVGGFAIFFFFRNLKIKPMPLINSLAMGTFGVLLIHDHNFFRYVLWGKIVNAPAWYSDWKFAFILGVFVIGIFAVCFAIDRVRANLIEKKIFGLKAVQKFCDKYDGIFQEKGEVHEK